MWMLGTLRVCRVTRAGNDGRLVVFVTRGMKVSPATEMASDGRVAVVEQRLGGRGQNMT